MSTKITEVEAEVIEAGQLQERRATLANLGWTDPVSDDWLLHNAAFGQLVACAAHAKYLRVQEACERELLEELERELLGKEVQS